MKKVLLSGLAFAALIAPAMAADMAPYLKSAPAPICAWCGWYVGVNAGYHWLNSGTVDTTTTNLSSAPGLNGDVGAAIAQQGTGPVTTKSGDFAGGGQFGFNWQAANVVYGIETDIEGMAGSHGATITNVGTVPGAAAVIASTGAVTSSKSVGYLGTLRGRAGYLFTPEFLVYGTGGLAYGGVRTSTTIVETLGFSDTPGTFGTSGSATATKIGWTAGVGVEWLFWSRWSAKIEYKYYDLGSVTNNIPSFQQFGGFGTTLETVNASQSSAKFSGSDVTFGVSLHF
jgi:outer membrane immunogenic protein